MSGAALALLWIIRRGRFDAFFFWHVFALFVFLMGLLLCGAICGALIGPSCTSIYAASTSPFLAEQRELQQCTAFIDPW